MRHNLNYNGFGKSVLQRLVKTSAKKNLYWEIKDKVIEESFNGIRAAKKTARVKCYGVDSTQAVRARLIEILYERVALHKDKFIAPILHSEMEAMEVKKSGKVEHSSNSHDDQVFSYLMAMYVWYDGIDVMERFNIQKNTLKTDEEVEIVESEIESDNGGLTTFDIETASKENDEVGDEFQEQMMFVAEAAKSQSSSQFYEQQKATDQASLNFLLQQSASREAYVKAYHIDLTEPAIGGSMNQAPGFTTLPDELFGNMELDDDEYMQPQDNLAGNLAGAWRQL